MNRDLIHLCKLAQAVRTFPEHSESLRGKTRWNESVTAQLPRYQIMRVYLNMNMNMNRHVGEWNFQRMVEKKGLVGNEDMSEKCYFDTKPWEIV